MKCTFVGVGSAFDAARTSTSVLIESAGHSMLLDCGFNAAHAFVRIAATPAALDLLWISHFHADHFFGIPFLIGYLSGAGRTRTLHVCGPAGIGKKVCELISMGYPNLLDRIGFEIAFHEFSAGDNSVVAGFNLAVCRVEHSQSALAVRVAHSGRTVFYTGDGSVSSGCRSLAAGVDLGIMEAFRAEEAVKGHSTIRDCLEFASEIKMRQVALVHLDPFVRTCMKYDICNILDEFKAVKAFLPDEGQSVLPGAPAGDATSEE